jgi:hypothetical protein
VGSWKLGGQPRLWAVAGSSRPFPEECSLASLPALLLREPIPLFPSSICNRYLFIFGSSRN